MKFEGINILLADSDSTFLREILFDLKRFDRAERRMSALENDHCLRNKSKFMAPLIYSRPAAFSNS